MTIHRTCDPGRATLPLAIEPDATAFGRVEARCRTRAPLPTHDRASGRRRAESGEFDRLLEALVGSRHVERHGVGPATRGMIRPRLGHERNRARDWMFRK